MCVVCGYPRPCRKRGLRTWLLLDLPLRLPIYPRVARVRSFGASCALLFGVESAPFSQPRAVIGGHVVSAAAGALAWEAVGGIELFAGQRVSCALARCDGMGCNA